jgi:hypothetical protein
MRLVSRTPDDSQERLIDGLVEENVAQGELIDRQRELIKKQHLDLTEKGMNELRLHGMVDRLQGALDQATKWKKQ